MFMYAKQSCINAVVPAPPSQFAMLYNDSQMMMVWSPVTEAVGYTMYWCRVLHNDRYCDVRRPSCRYTPVVLLIVTESQPVMLNEAKISRPRPGPCGRGRGPDRDQSFWIKSIKWWLTTNRRIYIIMIKTFEFKKSKMAAGGIMSILNRTWVSNAGSTLTAGADMHC